MLCFAGSLALRGTEPAAQYSSCVANGRGEASWLVRQYIVTEDLAETDYTGSAQDVTVLPNSTNVAPLASISASNTVGSSQPASNAIDGVISGVSLRRILCEALSDLCSDSIPATRQRNGRRTEAASARHSNSPGPYRRLLPLLYCMTGEQSSSLQRLYRADY